MLIGHFNSIEIDDTYTHPSGDTSERDVLEIAAAGSPVFLTTLNLDVAALTQSATFRIYYKIAGVYRLRYGAGPAGGSIMWTVADGDWISFLVNGIWDHDIKVTIQSAIAELTPVDIPYSYNGAR